MNTPRNASELLESASRTLGIRLADLVALASVWISPEVYEIVRPVGGVWFPDRRRANLGLRVDGKPVEAVGQVIDGITLDSNNYANVAFKAAIGVDRREFAGFHICHIWPGTAYDPACYTNLANLVAIPAELSSLTDHHPHIVACLKFRSWELYRWKPAKEIAPVRPAEYPERWADPEPVRETSRRAAGRRARGTWEEESTPPSPASPSPIDVQPSPARIRLRSADDVTQASILAAFYLSKFDHERLGLGNQGETIDRIARALQVNRNTMKNYRDYFDSHTGSRRQGWKVPLPPQLESAFRQLRSVDEESLRRHVLELIR